MRLQIIAIAILSLGLLACSLTNPQRSRASGYAAGDHSIDTVQDYYQQKRISEVQEAKQELGFNFGGELTESQQLAIRSRLLLKRLERNIPNDLERRQYYSLKPYFANDHQRIAFLQQPSREAKDRYAAAHAISSEVKMDATTQALIEESDVTKGMSREAVKLSWGEPDSIEVAGTALHGNERWIYRKLMSTEEGYRHETRMIYFESGRVTGWETE